MYLQQCTVYPLYVQCVLPPVLTGKSPTFGPHTVFGRSDSSSDYFTDIINHVVRITQAAVFGVKDDLHFCIKYIT